MEASFKFHIFAHIGFQRRQALTMLPAPSELEFEISLRDPINHQTLESLPETLNWRTNETHLQTENWRLCYALRKK